jgi:hypothetical protein
MLIMELNQKHLILTEFEKKSISQRRYIQIFNFALRKDKEKLKNN